jgi:hypothetical protein
MLLKNIIRISYIIGKRSIKPKARTVRTLATRFVPYVIDSGGDIHNLKEIVDKLVISETATLFIQILTVVINLSRLKKL